jgi:formimidoylglutamate deiminase
MNRVFARQALLHDGWATNVRFDIDDGLIARIEAGVAPDSAPVLGTVIPGLVNAHSHAFQRALAGHTEYRGTDTVDSFWTWRQRMYGLAARMTPARLEAVACQLYAEMLASGYTSVAEFHYLYGADRPDAGPLDYLNALVTAADQTGIRLAYVPVLYERGGFDGEALTPAQSGFALGIDEFLAHCDAARDRLRPVHRLAIGAHSLRAVSVDALGQIDAWSVTNAAPLHIHGAEQRREVEDCLRRLGASPVAWLLDNMPVNARWVLVHATHVDETEVRRLAHSGATVVLCPTTEGNLGDGIFPLADYLEAGGPIAIGSDSHVSVDPFEELRWLEYGQRLLAGARNVAAIGDDHSGSALYRRAVAGGARAAGLDGAGLAESAPADLVVLDDASPVLAGHASDTLLDALVFSGQPLPIDRAMVAGRWCIEGGRHARQADFAERYRRTAEAIWQPGKVRR